jgi:tetratricopeptide (TPR) repeat protein
MRTKALAATVAGLILFAAAPVPAQVRSADQGASAAPEMVHAEHHAEESKAPRRPVLLDGYGNGGFAISTKVPEAQAFFTNGMVLGAAFAHKASIAAMGEAVRLDPECAMCLWGLAFVSGPTLNYGSDAKERKPLRAMIEQARRLARSGATLHDQALIDALATRYRRGNVGKRDQDFAVAMAALALRFPEDDTIQVMAADAALVAVSEEADYPAAGKAAMAYLEPVLARSPNSTPAIHFYIHATEIAGEGAKAEPFADRLGGLAPSASHLVHMPSHSWYWVGRYQDAANANLRAVTIDEGNAARLGHTGHEGVFKLPYHAHNVIFGLGGAMMALDGQTALTLARPLVEVAQARTEAEPVMQLLTAAGYFASGRFETPETVLALAEPKLPYLKAAWHYARGEAFAARRDSAGLGSEIAAIPQRIATGKINDETRAPEQMLGITRAVLQGRLALIEGRKADAAAAFKTAAEIEETPDFSRFTDPPAFWYPVRRDLAAALLAAGDRAGALRELEASLKLRPKDPVALILMREIEAGSRPAS